MQGFTLQWAPTRLNSVLAIGSHPDDIEIGCGGTLLSLTRERPGLVVVWVVLCAINDRADEARTSAEAFLADAGRTEIRLHEFRDSFLPYSGGAVKEVFEALKSVEPDVIFTHMRSDLHQDHRLVSEVTWNTFRSHTILEYEVPKYDGDLGAPNVFVPLSEELAEEKLRLLHEHYATQAEKHWFDDELFRGLMRFRGVESATRFAEAFTCRKLALRLG